MLYRLLIITLLAAPFLGFSQTETFHDFRAKDIFGDSVDMSTFRGKKVMVVNTATFCEFTPQYLDLTDLYSLYNSHNFEIVGFPCNDFGGQEPGGDSTILHFCVDSLGIPFPMMSKISIISQDTAEVYKWLQNKSRNGVSDAGIYWNFYKFLIDEAGNWFKYYPSTKNPMDQEIIDWILSPSVLPNSPTGINESLQIDWTTPTIISGRLSASFTNLENRHTVVSIYSALGLLVQTVYDGSLHDGEIVESNISSLESGIYFLNVVNGVSVKTFRFSVVQ